MNHLLDYAAHAAIRGAVYRLVWHTPPIVACVLVMLAVVYVLRRYP